MPRLAQTELIVVHEQKRQVGKIPENRSFL